jgi:alanyl-tRNA synthetase
VKSDELRFAFLKFFEEKGHAIIPSSSLIPGADPTLLLTSAGMVQFKPYFLGETVPPNRRLASCQKCFRTTDIESVGDASHLTFFEMLGNFSIGDYFKREAINWAWEFITLRLGLPIERLWITIFLDDEESFRYWQEIGVPGNRILRFDEEDNFWGPAGNSGPCGPCSEIHYDFGEGVGCGQDTCGPSCHCGRFSEIWNLVFTQYNQDIEGNRTLLPRPNIDTGMGLERTAAVVQGKTSIYETDLFVTLMDRIYEMSGKKYGAIGSDDNYMRIIAEHSRGITFLIGDGAIPSNEGPGYVLRRLLRRTVLFGQRLGLDRPFLAETAKTVIKHMGHIYPEILQRQDFIDRVIELEEARFEETLNTGLELLDSIMKKAETRAETKISGQETFKLYDTYGFPVELTMEIASSHGFSVDMKGFDQKMEKQRERARSAHKFEIALKDSVGVGSQVDFRETPFVGYHRLRHKSVINSLLVDNKKATTIKNGQEATLILEDTPFYGEMGGQVGDTGEIRSPTGSFSVTSAVRLLPDMIIHQGYVTEGSLSVGDKIEAVVDMNQRLDIARNHTTTHLLQYALRKVLGEHVQQKGSLVAPDRLRFDFSHLTAMTREELKETQHIVNEKIRQNLPVSDLEVSYKKAIDEGAIALFDEKYGDIVRVVRIGEPIISAELCGGTHVALTGEIGLFHIIGESSIGAGLRRIEAVTGREALSFLEKRVFTLDNIAQSLESSVEDAPTKVKSLLKEKDKGLKRILAMEKEMAKIRAQSLISRVEIVNGVKLLVGNVDSSRIEILREMIDLLREQIKSGIIVLGSVYEDKPIFLAAVTPDLVARGYDAGKIIKKVAGVTGGGGGGKASLAQAGGKHKGKIDEALNLAKNLL